jgi:hypothetical protein
MIVLDASQTMQESFGGRSKWQAELESLSTILSGLQPNAHYGLVVVGGSSVNDPADLCGKPSAPALPFSSKEDLITQVNQLQPQGGGSFFNGYVLAKRLLKDLPANTVKTLIYITGPTDACESRDEWNDLQKTLSLPSDVNLYSEIIVLDENGLRSLVRAEQINSLSVRVNVQAPQNLPELQSVTSAQVVTNVNNYVNHEMEARASEVAPLVSQTPPTADKTTLPPTPVAPTPVPPTSIPPTFTLISPLLAWNAIPAQTDVFSPDCPLIDDANMFAQFYKGEARISATLLSNGRTNRGLRLDFAHVYDVGVNYAGWEVWLGSDNQTGIDLSLYDSLVFYIRGGVGGENPNVYLMMPATNDYTRHWKNVEEVTPVTQSWQRVVIPLSDFTESQEPHQQIDLHNIQRIQILFEWYSQPTSGSIFIDDLCVQPLPQPSTIIPPSPTPFSTNTLIPDISSALKAAFEEVDRQFNESLKSNITYVTPEKMEVDETFTIELLMNPSLSATQLVTQIVESSNLATATALPRIFITDLAGNLLTSTAAPGNLVTERGADVNIISNEIEITDLMKAVLTSSDPDAFIVQPLHDNAEQPVSTVETTKWRWSITAKKPGAQKLVLVIYRLIMRDEEKYWHEVESYNANIVVQVTPWNIFQQLDWLTIFGSVLGIIFTLIIIPLFLDWLRDKRKKSKTAASGKYTPLKNFFTEKSKTISEITLTFGEIEQIINDKLPQSAQKSQWWINEGKGHHIHTSAWVDVGWMVENVDITNQKVVFRKYQVM